MGKFIDLTGMKFGRLTVVKSKGKNKNGRHCWLCLCDCGNEKIAAGKDLRHGDTSSCGCYHMERIKESNFTSLVGQVFGDLKVMERTDDYIFSNNRKEVQYLCECQIEGNKIVVLATSLKQGHTTSCGCRLKRIPNRKVVDLLGRRFGKLVVMERGENCIDPKSQNAFVQWICKCDCGKTALIRSGNLKRGHVMSCGCLGESWIASELKKYFFENYSSIKEYKLFRNKETNQFFRCDIYIPSKNIFIEVHGQQHYLLSLFHNMMAKKRNSTPEIEFKKLKETDKIKKKYMKKHGTYIEVDLRKIKTTEDAIVYIEDIINKL